MATTFTACTALSFDHIIVNIRLDISVNSFCLGVVALAFRVVIISASTEKLLYFLWSERVRDVLRHALETADLAHSPIGVVADIGLSVAVELVGIGCKDGVEIESIVLPPLQTQVDTEVTPWFLLGCHVV